MRNKHHRGAGLLPAAVEEIKRLRAEWAALKDSDLLEVSLASINQSPDKFARPTHESHSKKWSANKRRSLEVLRGVVALVAVGSEPRALPLRAALAALGATVVPLWSPLVTHVVWSEGGDRESRAQARASAAHVVSPLWVEACATANRRVAESTFPAAARPSDLPSPSTLLSLLEKAENNNVPLAGLLLEKDKMSRKMGKPVATVTSRDIASDDSEDESADTSRATKNTTSVTTAETYKKNKNKSSTSTEDSPASDVEMRVNTNPRRALPRSYSPPTASTSASTSATATAGPKPEKALRKLFTQREVEPDSTDSDSDEAPALQSAAAARLTQRERAGLARAERRARRIAQPGLDRYNQAMPSSSVLRGPASGVFGPGPNTFEIRRHPALDRPTRRRPGIHSEEQIHSRDGKIRMVLSGMSRTERPRIHALVRRMHAKVQKNVTFKTTHVVVGSFGNDDTADVATDSGGVEAVAPRTLSALEGAARGARVVSAQWVLDSARARLWLAHRPYALLYLKNTSEKAFLERRAFNMMNCEYALNVFDSRRVRVCGGTSGAGRGAAHLLTLCGAVVLDEHAPATDFDTQPTQRSGNSSLPNLTQSSRSETNNGGNRSRLSEVVVGVGRGQVSERWVFDSVASARMRNTRRYIVTADAPPASQTTPAPPSTQVATVTQATATPAPNQNAPSTSANQTAPSSSANQAAPSSSTNQTAPSSSANPTTRSTSANQTAPTSSANQTAPSSSVNQTAPSSSPTQTASTPSANKVATRSSSANKAAAPTSSANKVATRSSSANKAAAPTSSANKAAAPSSSAYQTAPSSSANRTTRSSSANKAATRSSSANQTAPSSSANRTTRSSSANLTAPSSSAYQTAPSSSANRTTRSSSANQTAPSSSANKAAAPSSSGNQTARSSSANRTTRSSSANQAAPSSARA